jgi:hypothetical protein
MTDIWNNVYTILYDGAARPTALTSSLSNSTHPPTLYSVNAYNPLGEITSGTYGANGSGTTATAHSATFDNRGRLLTISDAVTAGSPYSLTLTYHNRQVASANDSVCLVKTLCTRRMNGLETSLTEGVSIRFWP